MRGVGPGEVDKIVSLRSRDIRRVTNRGRVANFLVRMAESYGFEYTKRKRVRFDLKNVRAGIKRIKRKVSRVVRENVTIGVTRNGAAKIRKRRRRARGY